MMSLDKFLLSDKGIISIEFLQNSDAVTLIKNTIRDRLWPFWSIFIISRPIKPFYSLRVETKQGGHPSMVLTRVSAVSAMSSCKLGN